MEFLFYNILLIEDDIIDAEHTVRIINKTGLNFRLIWVKNGEDGIAKMDYLQESSKLPTLIILDLNLPKLKGKEFIAIAEQRDWKNFHLIIMTTSLAPEDLALKTKKIIGKYFIKSQIKNEFSTYLINEVPKYLRQNV